MAIDTTPEITPIRRTGAILVVDDENSARHVLCQLLRDDGHEVQDAPDGFKAMGILKEWTPDIILTDLKMPLMDGITLLRKTRELHPDITCIVMTAFASVETAVQSMKSGANDYLTKPLNFDAVELVIQRSLERIEMVRELQDLREQSQKQKASKIIGNAGPMQQMLSLIDQIAPSRATVLITGESGTGKEMVARRVHDMSPRINKPFMTIHCAALPENLLESELFGHEKGSFTGAAGMRRGRFEDADGGTLFLDEIGEISPSTQVKLLRFLQTREFERVGGNQTHSVDVRIVAATNRNLEEEVRNGNFREDLYYRLNVINVETPPLRVRRSDIPVLIRHFVDRYARENGKTIREVSTEVVHTLEAYDWPGNVRELENVIEPEVQAGRPTVVFG
jgi:DNA-binding NtrC family response regulator